MLKLDLVSLQAVEMKQLISLVHKVPKKVYMYIT